MSISTRDVNNVGAARTWDKGGQGLADHLRLFSLSHLQVEVMLESCRSDGTACGWHDIMPSIRTEVLDCRGMGKSWELPQYFCQLRAKRSL